jgi:hypothetical protein
MLKYVLGVFIAVVCQVHMLDSCCAWIILLKQNGNRQKKTRLRVILKRMGQCYSLEHGPATLSASSRVRTIIESGENGYTDGIYYSVALRDPTNGRISIKTTPANQKK